MWFSEKRGRADKRKHSNQPFITHLVHKLPACCDWSFKTEPSLLALHVHQRSTQRNLCVGKKTQSRQNNKEENRELNPHLKTKSLTAVNINF